MTLQEDFVYAVVTTQTPRALLFPGYGKTETLGVYSSLSVMPRVKGQLQSPYLSHLHTS